MATDSIPFASDAETPLPAESLEVGVVFRKHPFVSWLTLTSQSFQGASQAIHERRRVCNHTNQIQLRVGINQMQENY